RAPAATRNRAGAPSAVKLQVETGPHSGEVREAVGLRRAVRVVQAAAKRERVTTRSRAWVRCPTFRNSIVRAAPLPTAASWHTRRTVAGQGWRWPSQRRRPLLSTAPSRFAMPSIRLADALPKVSRSKMGRRWVGRGKRRSKLHAIAGAARPTTQVRPFRAARTPAPTSNTAACRQVDLLVPCLQPIVCKRHARIARV